MLLTSDICLSSFQSADEVDDISLDNSFDCEQTQGHQECIRREFDFRSLPNYFILKITLLTDSFCFCKCLSILSDLNF